MRAKGKWKARPLQAREATELIKKTHHTKFNGDGGAGHQFGRGSQALGIKWCAARVVLPHGLGKGGARAGDCERAKKVRESAGIRC